MKTLVIASQKGGVGKTTLAAHLAVAATKSGAGPVALLDTDPQGSLAEWWNQRTEPEPHFTTSKLEGIGTHLAALAAAGYQLIIIDTPPAVSATIRTVVAQADLVLIPTRPSPIDLRAVGATVGLADAEKKRMTFVINGAANRAKITGEAAVALSQHGTVAPTVVYQRTVFASAMTDGHTAQEIDPRSEAANEVNSLWQYLASQLERA